jgi:hypothetical protein
MSKKKPSLKQTESIETISTSLLFDKNEVRGRIISHETAVKWIKKYQDSAKEGQEILKSLVVSKKAINAIFAQDECVDIRIYIAEKINALTPVNTLILVGTDKDGSDVVEMGIIIENLIPCPPVCNTLGTTILDKPSVDVFV